MRALYLLGLLGYKLIILLASPFNAKAAKWIKGRRDWKLRIREIAQKRQDKKHLFWFHCASLGEYEQALPIIKGTKDNYPGAMVVVSFFSPSGYENFKPNELVNEICYLPLDTPGNAKTFIETLKPSVAFFVKYEIWHNLIDELKNQNIPTYLVAAHFRTDQIYFRSYGTWFRKTLQYFNHIFVQQSDNIELLKSIGVSHCSVSGDTRIDRVLENVAESKTVPQALNFLGEEKAIILGSAWPAEIGLIKAFIEQTNYVGKVIVAPHEIHENSIREIEEQFEKFKVQRFSSSVQVEDAQILIIDSIGQLKHLYAYAKVALVGGAFGNGLHNILEAVTYGIPVLFGPNHHNFPEAAQLIQLKCAYSVGSSDEFIKEMNELLNNPMKLKVVENMAKKYIRDHSGAAVKIINKIEETI